MKSENRFSIVYKGRTEYITMHGRKKYLSGLTRYGIDHTDKPDVYKRVMEKRLREAFRYIRRYRYQYLDDFVEHCM